MIRPVQTAAPAELPVTLAEAKAQANISHADDDTLITSFIEAATAVLDGYSGVLGRCIVSQQWRQDFTDWAWRLRLPFPDVSSVTITYEDQDNQAQTVSADDYEVIEDARGSVVVFRDAFEEPGLYDDKVAPVHVAFTAGYGDAADVPANIKAAIKLLVAHFDANREAVGTGVSFEELPMGVQYLANPHRRVAV